MVADRNPFDALADLVHHPGGVLPEPGGQFEGADPSELTFTDPPVDGVHARRSNGYANQAGSRVGLLDVFESQDLRSTEPGEAHSSHAGDHSTNG
ncbi:hypothetical protein GCM10027160_53730 [Streptomyces calidiresistens]